MQVMMEAYTDEAEGTWPNMLDYFIQKRKSIRV